jgi:PncC family amidohydrolase
MKIPAKLRCSIDNKAVNVVKLLSSRNETLASAESCTGGLFSAAITAVPGASRVFGLGMCTYNNGIKTRFLGVPERVLNTYTAVSRQTAALMARNIRKQANADYGIGITGYAGPAQGEWDEQVGLVYIGMSCAGRTVVRACHFNPEIGREGVRMMAAAQAMILLEKAMKSTAE